MVGSNLFFLILGAAFLYGGVKSLGPVLLLTQNKEAAVGVGILFITKGFFGSLSKILKIKNELVPLYVGVVTGILILMAGFILLHNNSSFGAGVLAPGLLWFLGNFISLLKKKYPNQEFFGKKS